MEKINFAIIGCGRIALRYIDAIQLTKQASLVALCDINIKLAKDKATLANIPFYHNYHDMLKRHAEINVVIILTPSGAHFSHAIDILQRYRKHLIIEKPLVLTTSQGEKLKHEVERLQLKIFPVYQNRYNKAIQRVKYALTNNELGKVRIGTIRMRWCRPQRYYDLSPWRGTWAMDGGALTNQGIHYIDLLRYLCGEIKRVNAKLTTLGANIEVEDTGIALIEFHSGALGVIEITTAARPHDFESSISCVCENGLAVIGGIATNQLQTFSPDPSQEIAASEEFSDAYGNGHNAFIQDIIEALLHNKPPLVEFADGLQTIKLLHALYKSDEQGSWVNIEEDGDSKRLGRPDPALEQLYMTPLNTIREEIYSN